MLCRGQKSERPSSEKDISYLKIKSRSLLYLNKQVKMKNIYM